MSADSEWPPEIEKGLVPTDNAMGVMTKEISPAGEAFVQLAAHAEWPLLDVGAAYGNVTLPALQAGATVIANDLSASALAILAAAAPEEARRRLVLAPARFPDDLPIGDSSLSGILLSQVLHFLDGPTVERSFTKAFRWLAPGGGLFVVVMTPSLSYYRLLRGAYEERAARGERWPGIFDPRAVATPEWRDRLPEMVNLFEQDVLRRSVEEAGFAIETMEYFCYRNFPDRHRTNGREYITLTARKPPA